MSSVFFAKSFLLNSSGIPEIFTFPSKFPWKKQLTLPIVFFSDLNQDFSMNKVDGPVEINECILANVSETEDLANISRLNLLLSIANEECYQQIKNGRLYLQGTVYISGQLKLLSFFKDICVSFIPFFCFCSLLVTKVWIICFCVWFQPF